MSEDETSWRWMRNIPVVNTVYGSLRCVYYLPKGIYNYWYDNKDYNKDFGNFLESLFVAIGGGVGIYVGMVAAPTIGIAAVPAIGIWLVIKIAVQMAAGGFAQQVFISIGEISKKYFGSELKNMNSDEWESWVYDKIFKAIPFIGAIYSLIRAAAYKFKGDQYSEKVSENLWNCFINTLSSSLGLAGGVLFTNLAKTEFVCKLIDKACNACDSENFYHGVENVFHSFGDQCRTIDNQWLAEFADDIARYLAQQPARVMVQSLVESGMCSAGRYFKPFLEKQDKFMYHGSMS